MAKKGILERLSEGVVLGDGGYVLELERRGYIIAGPFTPEVCLEHPSAVRELNHEFVLAGADVIQALAFYASREKLATVGYGEQVLEVNRKAVQIAKEVAGDDVLVAGNLSTTWDYRADDPSSHDVVRKQFQEQLEVQVDEGVDFVIGELFFDLAEALLSVKTAKAFGLPYMVTMTFAEQPVTRDGKSPAECARALMDAGADIVGLNCYRGPDHMLPLAQQMRKAVDGYIAVQAPAFRTTDAIPFFAGLPGFPNTMEPYQLTRFEMADYARKAKDMGVNYIGGCCGTIPTHIREMAKALGKPVKEKRVWQPDYESPMSATEEFNEYRKRARERDAS
ncbi:MAG: homocysteine S-methyltransferase family protein [Dehalococcoidia bacterium]